MKNGKIAKIDKMLLVSGVLFVIVFGIIIYQMVVGNTEDSLKKTLPQFEVEEEIPTEIEAEGTFLGMFGDKYVDIKIDGSTLMFIYEEVLKEKMGEMKRDDFVSLTYLENEDEKEKKIIAIEVVEESNEEETEEVVEIVDKEKALKGIYTKVNVVEGKENKRVDFEVYNDSQVKQTLYFPTGQQYEIVVKNSNGDAVYTYSKNYSISQNESEITIEPGDKHVFTTEIKPLKKGTYQMDVWLLSQNTEELRISEEVQGKSEGKVEKEISYQTENGTVNAPASLKQFDEDKEWYVIDGLEFSGNQLNAENYTTTISAAQKQNVQEERWAAAEILKKEGTMLEKNNLLATDEFVFFVEKSGGVVQEFALKNIDGQMYRFETVYENSWIDSRNEIEAMVQTIK